MTLHTTLVLQVRYSELVVPVRQPLMRSFVQHYHAHCHAIKQIAALGRELDKEVTSGRALRSKLRDVTRKLAAYERTATTTTTANTSTATSALRGGIAARSSRYIHAFNTVYAAAYQVNCQYCTYYSNTLQYCLYDCCYWQFCCSAVHGTSASCCSRSYERF
jgi:hypothetical protein